MFAHRGRPARPRACSATIGASGDVLLGKIDDYDAVSLGWSSNLNRAHRSGSRGA